MKRVSEIVIKKVTLMSNQEPNNTVNTKGIIGGIMNANVASNLPAESPDAFGEDLALLDRLRQDQLEAAEAGHLAESAFYATEVRLLRQELDGQNSLFLCA
jgi:hypothetical protein